VPVAAGPEFRCDVTHDMSLMIELSDRMAVMYAGRFVEMADAKEVFTDPLHPYTKALINAFPPLHGPNTPLAGLAEGVRFTDIPTSANSHPATGSTRSMPIPAHRKERSDERQRPSSRRRD